MNNINNINININININNITINPLTICWMRSNSCTPNTRKTSSCGGNWLRTLLICPH